MLLSFLNFYRAASAFSKNIGYLVAQNNILDIFHQKHSHKYLNINLLILINKTIKSGMYLEPCQTSKNELFCKNI